MGKHKRYIAHPGWVHSLPLPHWRPSLAEGMCGLLNGSFHCKYFSPWGVLLGQGLVQNVRIAHGHVHEPPKNLWAPVMLFTVSTHVVFCLSAIALIDQIEGFGVVL